MRYKNIRHGGIIEKCVFSKSAGSFAFRNNTYRDKFMYCVNLRNQNSNKKEVIKSNELVHCVCLFAVLNARPNSIFYATTVMAQYILHIFRIVFFDVLRFSFSNKRHFQLNLTMFLFIKKHM